MRVLLHTGKGGVGKTTVALATALVAAEHGHRVCVLSTDPAHSLADALAKPVGPDLKRISPGVWVREIRAQTELDRAWGPIQDGLRALLRADADATLPAYHGVRRGRPSTCASPASCRSRPLAIRRSLVGLAGGPGFRGVGETIAGVRHGRAGPAREGEWMRDASPPVR